MWFHCCASKSVVGGALECHFACSSDWHGSCNSSRSVRTQQPLCFEQKTFQFELQYFVGDMALGQGKADQTPRLHCSVPLPPIRIVSALPIFSQSFWLRSPACSRASSPWCILNSRTTAPHNHMKTGLHKRWLNDTSEQRPRKGHSHVIGFLALDSGMRDAKEARDGRIRDLGSMRKNKDTRTQEQGYHVRGFVALVQTCDQEVYAWVVCTLGSPRFHQRLHKRHKPHGTNIASSFKMMWS